MQFHDASSHPGSATVCCTGLPSLGIWHPSSNSWRPEQHWYGFACFLQSFALDGKVYGFQQLQRAAHQEDFVGSAKWMRWACGLQNARGEQGNTALHLAGSRGHVAAVKMLLSKGATTVSSATQSYFVSDTWPDTWTAISQNWLSVHCKMQHRCSEPCEAP